MKKKTHLVKVTLKDYSSNTTFKYLQDFAVNLPAPEDELVTLLREAKKNLFLDKITVKIHWLFLEDMCFGRLDQGRSVIETIFQLNEFCKRLTAFNLVQKRKLNGIINALSGIEGPDGIGPWTPDLVYAVNFTYILDNIGYIGGITKKFELGTYVINHKKLPAIQNVNDEIVKLLDREAVVISFMEKLKEKNKLKNFCYVDNDMFRKYNGFFYNVPDLNDIPKIYDGKLQAINL